MIPFLGISAHADNSELKSRKTYANNDEKPVSNLVFVGQDVPENAKGQTFLSKHIPKAINTTGRIIVHDIDGIFKITLQNEVTASIPRPLTISHYFIDRFLRSSISPQAP